MAGRGGLVSEEREMQFYVVESLVLMPHYSADGLQLSEEKIRAIIDSPPPQNIGQLRSFLGMINYNANSWSTYRVG